VIVAIFGYFYTVLPVYQKERLAEQVAEYDGIIKKQGPKIVEMEQQLVRLQKEREQLSATLKRERDHLSAELRNIERQLAAARREKAQIEEQIQFMAFRYRLPDGRPAKTHDEVKVAQETDLKRSFLTSLQSRCTFRYGGREPFSAGFVKRDPSSKSFPFSEEELAIWKEHGAKYPLKFALDCIDSVAADYSKQYVQSFSQAFIDSLRSDAVRQTHAAAATAWAAPLEPLSVIQELVTKRPAIEKERVAAHKKVDEEYGDWASAFGEARRVLFKHNYEVGRQNADTIARTNLMNLEWAAQKKADEFRKTINDEIGRLFAFAKRV
jgi:hypothetical protein